MKHMMHQSWGNNGMNSSSQGVNSPYNTLPPGYRGYSLQGQQGKPPHRQNSTPNSDARKRFECPDCDLKFATHSGLRFHSVKHGSRDFQYRCPFCNKGFNATHHVKKHLKNHGGTGKNYYCYLCDSVIEKVKDFVEHAHNCKRQRGLDIAGQEVPLQIQPGGDTVPLDNNPLG